MKGYNVIMIKLVVFYIVRSNTDTVLLLAQLMILLHSSRRKHVTDTRVWC